MSSPLLSSHVRLVAAAPTAHPRIFLLPPVHDFEDLVTLGILLPHEPLADSVLVNLENIDRSSVVGFRTRMFERARDVDRGAIWVPVVDDDEFLAKHRWWTRSDNLWGIRVVMGEQLRITVGAVGEVDRCECLCISVPTAREPEVLH